MIVIDKKKWYKPREIARENWIQAPGGTGLSENGNYNYILNLIRTGRLKARNYSVAAHVKYWLVSEDEIKRYSKATH